MNAIFKNTKIPFFHADDCSCGGSHEHHEHDCDCGHEHHEHDCDCGHEHHEHDCDCGHEHHGHDCDHNHKHSAEPRATANSLIPAKAVYVLENLSCAHCASKMEEKINALNGVESATITYATKQLRLNAPNPDALLPQIQQICTSIESQVIVRKNEPEGTAGRSNLSHTHDIADNEHSVKKETKKELLELAGIIAGAVLFLAGVLTEHFIPGSSEPFRLPVFVIAYLILGGPILLEAARNISHGQIFDENFLMSIATLGAFAIRDYPEAVGVMLFYRVGEFFEHKAVERSRSQIMGAVDMRPETVNLVSETGSKIIPARDAQPGDILLVRPGDRIPLDGTILEGSSRIDTSPITGEPVPVTVNSGDEVISGCVNTSGQLKIRVEKPLAESMVTRILDSVENAAASKPKIDRFITKFAKVYTPCVVFGAIAVAILPSLFTGNWHYWIYTAISFLVMSCPCALVLSVPLAFFSGIGAGSKKGILFKGGVSIEALGSVHSVVMDKTGTVTKGDFRLQRITTCSTWSEDDLLRICAGCEQNSSHPIAVSIVAAAKEKGIVFAVPETLEEIAGHGISATVAEGHVLCGNRKLMERFHIDLTKMPEASYGAEVFLAINGTPAGCMVISDTIKPDAISAIRKLKAQGLHTVMLTGDSQATADAVARETGIDEVHAKLLPQDKLQLLSQVRTAHGAVMFVGDGINDAPVLAGADVGAAMGSGADAAIEAADAVFMTSAMEAIPDSIFIARSTSRIAMQNVVFALIIKLIVIALGLAGFANMWMAVFADTGVAMLCVLNSIRILYKK
ncbi:MAG: cadmium-translocating P-type ATPase [Lachnospiraceae bacterium]|jgi:Cd2+/Zn2+-exporting ATPase|nr:cadmium-translocating P-type ATPase [Lachnospiraceae bacterium]RKJ50953.1 cadmium-translocating P-type ATPase [bacterium 1XD42-54]